MPRQVGQLAIDLVARTAAFHNEMRRSAQRFDRTLGGMQRTAQRVGRVLTGALAGLGATVGFRQILENTRRQEQAMAQLAAAVQSTGGVAGRSAEQLARFAGQLQSLTTYGDEAVMEMQSILLTFTQLRGGVLEEATRAVLDVATRMDQDLKSAAIQVGKALNDPIRNLSGLSRAGIQFSESQRATIQRMVEMGNVAEAQRVILKELETQFGGSARAARQTLGGALQSLANILGDQLELDKNLTEPLRQAVEAVIRNFETVKNTVIALAGAIAGVALPLLLAKVAAGFRGIAAAVKALTVALARNPLGFLAVVVTTVAAELLLFRDHLVEIQGHTARVGDIVLVVWRRLQAGLQALQQQFLDSVAYVTAPATAGQSAFLGFFNRVLGWAKNFINKFMGLLNLIPVAASEAAGALYANFTRAFEMIWDWDFSGFTGVMGQVWEQVQKQADAALHRDYLGDMALATGRLGDTLTDSLTQAVAAWKTVVADIMREAEQLTAARAAEPPDTGPIALPALPAATAPPAAGTAPDTEAHTQALAEAQRFYRDLRNLHQDYLDRRRLATMDAFQAEIEQMRLAKEQEMQSLAERAAAVLDNLDRDSQLHEQISTQLAQTLLAIHRDTETQIAQLTAERIAAQEQMAAEQAQREAQRLQERLLRTENFTNGVLVYFQRLNQSLYTLAEAGWEAAQRIHGAFEYALSDSIFNLLTGRVDRLIDVVRGFAESIVRAFADITARLLAQKVAMWVAGEAYGKAALASTVAEATAASTAWAPAAAFASLATLGTNAAPASAALVGTLGLAKGLSVIPGLAEGGIVTKPTLIQAGEAGTGGEAVIPFNNRGIGILQKALQPMVDTVRRLMQSMPSLSMPTPMALGGVITQPTLIQAGEPGTGGEAVIPFNERGIGILQKALEKVPGNKETNVHQNQVVNRSIHLHNPTFLDREQLHETIKQLSVQAWLDDYSNAGETRVIVNGGY